jgi:hypothetical protein
MTNERDRFEKVLAIAINPGAYEGEAMAALRKARELVKHNPSLAHPKTPPTPKPSFPDDDALEVKITNIFPYWLNIFLNGLSAEAYGLARKIHQA